MLFNAAAKRLFEAVPDVRVVAHDWWAYQLVSGAGGTVIYDPEPTVDYRQHGANLIGGNQGLRAKWAAADAGRQAGSPSTPIPTSPPSRPPRRS